MVFTHCLNRMLTPRDPRINGTKILLRQWTIEEIIWYWQLSNYLLTLCHRGTEVKHRLHIIRQRSLSPQQEDQNPFVDSITQITKNMLPNCSKTYIAHKTCQKCSLIICYVRVCTIPGLVTCSLVRLIKACLVRLTKACPNLFRRY